MSSQTPMTCFYKTGNDKEYEQLVMRNRNTKRELRVINHRKTKKWTIDKNANKTPRSMQFSTVRQEKTNREYNNVNFVQKGD